MTITDCSKCGMKVIPMSDGRCPSCGHRILAGDSLAQVIESVAVRSPKVDNHLSAPRIPKHFDLLWIMFSLRGRLSLGLIWILGTLSIIIWMLLMSLGGLLSNEYPILAVMYFLSLLIVFWSSVAITVKRFHDLGWPAWLIFLGLIPGFGPIFLFFTIGNLKGQRGSNRYGVDPRRIWSAGMLDEQ